MCILREPQIWDATSALFSGPHRPILLQQRIGINSIITTSKRSLILSILSVSPCSAVETSLLSPWSYWRVLEPLGCEADSKKFGHWGCLCEHDKNLARPHLSHDDGCLFIWDRVSIHNPGYLQNHDPPASSFWFLGVQMCAHMTSFHSVVLLCNMYRAACPSNYGLKCLKRAPK